MLSLALLIAALVVFVLLALGVVATLHVWALAFALWVAAAIATRTLDGRFG